MALKLATELAAGLASGVLVRAKDIAFGDSDTTPTLKSRIMTIEQAIAGGVGGGTVVGFDPETRYITVDGEELVYIPQDLQVPTNLLRIAGTVTLGTVVDETTQEERPQTLAEALAAIEERDDPQTGDIYLYNNTNDNLTEEWACIKTTQNNITTTAWQLVGVKQAVTHVTAEQVLDENEQPVPNRYMLRFQ